MLTIALHELERLAHWNIVDSDVRCVSGEVRAQSVGEYCPSRTTFHAFLFKFGYLYYDGSRLRCVEHTMPACRKADTKRQNLRDTSTRGDRIFAVTARRLSCPVMCKDGREENVASYFQAMVLLSVFLLFSPLRSVVQDFALTVYRTNVHYYSP